MAKVRSLYLGAASLLLAAFVVPQTFVPARAEQIAATVNSIVITSSDVAKRVKFLQLRGDRKGNLQQKAKQELVDEVLMRQEIIRTGTSVSTDDVDAAYERFAKNNKMSSAQLTQILHARGRRPGTFQGLYRRLHELAQDRRGRFGGSSGRMSNDEFIAKLKANNGQKPAVTEYVIQQVIFVIPDKKRNAISGKRKAEAEAARKSFPARRRGRRFSPPASRTSGLVEQQRVLETQFPDEMKADMAKIPEGGTSKVTLGPDGAEFYAVCKKRQVSDDLAAQVTYETQDLSKAEKEGENPNSKKYLEELRKQNDITVR